jgi:hypothetical protein
MYASSRTRTTRPRHSLTAARPGLLQRRCACGGTPGLDGECAACRRKRLQRLDMASSTREAGAAPPMVHEVLRSPGQPLDERTRAFMEPRFRHDFSRVRVHSDRRAAESARAVGALAYTVGQSVVFGDGQYVPGTRSGRHLLAHELTHVVQQRGAVGTASGIGTPADLYEREAEQTARIVVDDGAVPTGGHRSTPLSGPARIQRLGAYSGWHGHSGSMATYPGAGTDPLLNADSYTTLAMGLS